MTVAPTDMFQGGDSMFASGPRGSRPASEDGVFQSLFADAARSAAPDPLTPRPDRRSEDRGDSDGSSPKQEATDGGRNHDASAADESHNPTSPVAATSDGSARETSRSAKGEAHSASNRSGSGPRTPASLNAQAQGQSRGAASNGAAEGAETAGSASDRPASETSGGRSPSFSPARPSSSAGASAIPGNQGGSATTQRLTLEPTRLDAQTFAAGSKESDGAGTENKNNGASGGNGAGHQPGRGSTGGGSPVPLDGAAANVESSTGRAGHGLEPIRIELPFGGPQAAAPGAATAATAAGPTAEAALPLPDAHHLTDQVGRALRSMVQQRGGTMTLRLNPPEMGMVRIELRIEANTVQARFEVTSEAVRTVLQQHFAQLKDALVQQGLTVDQLQVQNGSASFGRDAETEAPDDGRSRGRRDEEPTSSNTDTEDGSDDRFDQELLDLMA
ncbi:MAG: flagellar hook-length control protein FliK [Phycisphaeraceae bacterium]|nr:flagellar hook-length control protein FliK [Phycisphaeraceae bacterium]